MNESDYTQAVAKSRKLSGKGISKQTFAIITKIREVDQLLADDTRARSMVREVHPELCFWGLTGDRDGVCARLIRGWRIRVVGGNIRPDSEPELKAVGEQTAIGMGLDTTPVGV